MLTDLPISLIQPRAQPSLFEVNRTGLIVFIFSFPPPSGAVLLKTMPQLFLTKVHKKKEGKNEGVFAVISSDEVGTQ